MSLKKATLVSALRSREIELSSYRRDRITSLILANLITKVSKPQRFIVIFWSASISYSGDLGLTHIEYNSLVLNGLMCCEYMLGNLS